MRTKGALNRPKFINVKVADLLSVFKEDAVIAVSVQYASLFGGAEPSKISKDVVEKAEKEEENIQISVIDLNK